MALLIRHLCFLSLILCACLVSCKNNNENPIGNTKFEVIVDLGNPALDGCGWVIQIDGENNRATEIDSNFLEDSLLVRIHYNKLQSVSTCGLGSHISEIEINNISRF